MEAQLLHNIFLFVVSSRAAGVAEAASEDGGPPPTAHSGAPPQRPHGVSLRARVQETPPPPGPPASLILLTGLPAHCRSCRFKITSMHPPPPPRFNALLVSTTQRRISKGPNKPPQSLYTQTLMTSLQSTVVNRSPSHLVAAGPPVGALWFPLFYDGSMATMAGIQLRDGCVDWEACGANW